MKRYSLQHRQERQPTGLADAIEEASKAPSQSLRMVLVVLIVVPIACAYPFFQRYIVAGLTVGSVKG